MADLVKKDIRYLSRDFGSLKQNLIDFAKNYFPTHWIRFCCGNDIGSNGKG